MGRTRKQTAKILDTDKVSAEDKAKIEEAKAKQEAMDKEREEAIKREEEQAQLEREKIIKEQEEKDALEKAKQVEKENNVLHASVKAIESVIGTNNYKAIASRQESFVIAVNNRLGKDITVEDIIEAVDCETFSDHNAFKAELYWMGEGKDAYKAIVSFAKNVKQFGRNKVNGQELSHMLYGKYESLAERLLA